MGGRLGGIDPAPTRSHDRDHDLFFLRPSFIPCTQLRQAHSTSLYLGIAPDALGDERDAHGITTHVRHVGGFSLELPRASQLSGAFLEADLSNRNGQTGRCYLCCTSSQVTDFSGFYIRVKHAPTLHRCWNVGTRIRTSDVAALTSDF